MAGCDLDEPLEAGIAVRKDVLGRQALELLAPAELRHVVRTRAEETLVMVVGVFVVDHVRAAHAVEDVEIVHGVNRSLQLEVVQIEHGQDHEICLERLEEPGANDGRGDSERVEAAARRREQGRRGLRGDVTDGTREPFHQEVDERLEVMPILVGLGVEDDVAVRRRESLEAPEVAPALPQLHRVSRRRTAYSFAGDALSASPGGGSLLAPRTRRTTRYPNSWSPTTHAATTPITAEMIMLPVPGSRYAWAGDARDSSAARTRVIRRVIDRAPREF